MAFLNLKFPLQDDKEKNFFVKRNDNTPDAIKSNLYFLLTTEKKSRFYNRSYGTDLRKFIFEQNDEVTVFDIEQEIKNTVKKFMPNLTINNVAVEQNENTLLLTIYFTYIEDFYSFSDAIAISF